MGVSEVKQLDFKLYVRHNNARININEIKAQPGLVKQVDLSGDPIGGLSLSDSTNEVLLDDTLHFIARAFLYDGVIALENQKPFTYNLRLSPGSVGIDLRGKTATVFDDNDDRLIVDVDTLIANLISARQVYESIHF